MPPIPKLNGGVLAGGLASGGVSPPDSVRSAESSVANIEDWYAHVEKYIDQKTGQKKEVIEDGDCTPTKGTLQENSLEEITNARAANVSKNRATTNVGTYNIDNELTTKLLEGKLANNGSGNVLKTNKENYTYIHKPLYSSTSTIAGISGIPSSITDKVSKGYLTQEISQMGSHIGSKIHFETTTSRSTSRIGGPFSSASTSSRKDGGGTTSSAAMSARSGSGLFTGLLGGRSSAAGGASSGGGSSRYNNGTDVEESGTDIEEFPYFDSAAESVANIDDIDLDLLLNPRLYEQKNVSTMDYKRHQRSMREAFETGLGNNNPIHAQRRIYEGSHSMMKSVTSSASSIGSANPYSLVSASVERHQSAMSKKDHRKFTDPRDPAAQEYLRARYPDFDEYLACLNEVDYKYECSHDAKFASKYRVPPPIEPVVKLGGSAESGGHLKGVDSVVWLPEDGTTKSNGKKFITGGHDGIRVWGPSNSTAAMSTSGIGVLQSIDAMPSFDSVLSKDGKLFISGGPSSEDYPATKRGSLGIFQVHEGGVGISCLQQALPGVHLHCVNTHPVDGKTIITGDSGGRTMVIDLAKNSIIWGWDTHYFSDYKYGVFDILNQDQSSGSAVTGVQFSEHNPCHFASCGKDGAIRIWDIRRKMNPKGTTSGAMFWNLPSAVNNSVKYNLCDVELNQQSVNTYCREPGELSDGRAVFAIEWLDGNTLMSVGADNKCKRWDIRHMRTQEVYVNPIRGSKSLKTMETSYGPLICEEFLGHTQPIRGVSISPDKKYVCTSCEDGSSRIFKIGELESKKNRLQNVIAKKRAANDEEDMEIRARLCKKYNDEGKALQKDIQQIMRDGFSQALVSMIGHSLCVTQAAWIPDPYSSRGDRYRIATTSWDQTVNLYDLDLTDM